MQLVWEGDHAVGLGMRPCSWSGNETMQLVWERDHAVGLGMRPCSWSGNETMQLAWERAQFMLLMSSSPRHTTMDPSYHQHHTVTHTHCKLAVSFFVAGLLLRAPPSPVPPSPVPILFSVLQESQGPVKELEREVDECAKVCTGHIALDLCNCQWDLQCECSVHVCVGHVHVHVHVQTSL